MYFLIQTLPLTIWICQQCLLEIIMVRKFRPLAQQFKRRQLNNADIVLPLSSGLRSQIILLYLPRLKIMK
jgi:hypothetical protein